MTNKLKKLTIILYTGDKEKINYALSIVATAAALERSTELFFTGKSIQFLMANNKDSNYNHANSEELLSTIIDLGAELSVCSGALSENNIKENELRNDIKITLTGLTSILSVNNQESQIIFI